MEVRPTPEGGRTLKVSTPWGAFDIKVDPAGADRPLSLVDASGAVVGTARVTIREPAPPDAPAQETPQWASEAVRRAHGEVPCRGCGD